MQLSDGPVSGKIHTDIHGFDKSAISTMETKSFVPGLKPFENVW